MKNYLLFFAFMGLLQWNGYAQERVTVEDPEMAFSFVKPTKWKIYDTDLYYLIYKPGLKNAYVSITYVAAGEGEELQEMFDFTVNDLLPLNIEDYEVIDKGEDTVGELDAFWVTYSSTFEGLGHKNIYYLFQKDGQVFKVLGTCAIAEFEGLEPEFVKIIKSIEAKRIEG